MDSAYFFHPDGERGPARARREAKAKEVCQRCPVIAQCRNHALRVQEPYGIWGGLSESEREMIIKARKRQHQMIHPEVPQQGGPQEISEVPQQGGPQEISEEPQQEAARLAS